jgi:uncharacterized protein
LQDGPIDLVIGANSPRGNVKVSYEAATHRFATILDELCSELDNLRKPAVPGVFRLTGPVARRMEAAVQPFASEIFITPMAAVAGAVAEEILETMIEAAPLRRAYVNNGGDIAIHLDSGASYTIGLISKPERPSLFGTAALNGGNGVTGIATSGWRGRSFSLGIADAVTVLARSASEADAAATVIANAADIPDHPGIVREPACNLKPDSDLGQRPVTRHVPKLSESEISIAIASAAACASRLARQNLIRAAAIHLQGATIAIAAPDQGLLLPAQSAAGSLALAG